MHQGKSCINKNVLSNQNAVCVFRQELEFWPQEALHQIQTLYRYVDFTDTVFCLASVSRGHSCCCFLLLLESKLKYLYFRFYLMSSMLLFLPSMFPTLPVWAQPTEHFTVNTLPPVIYIYSSYYLEYYCWVHMVLLILKHIN